MVSGEVGGENLQIFTTNFTIFICMINEPSGVSGGLKTIIDCIIIYDSFPNI